MAFTDRLHNRGSISTGYNVDYSCKFEHNNAESLSRAQAQGNQQTWTFSTWLKRTQLSENGNEAYQNIWSAGSSTSNATHMYFRGDSTFPDNKIFFYMDNGGSQYFHGATPGSFRDTSAWYHIVWAVDTTQGTASNRSKVYINGELQTLESVSGASRSDPAQNASTRVMDNGGDMYIGALAGNGGYRFNGYMAETVLVDGTQLQASDFGEYDSASGIWIPKDVSTISKGTRGFYLDYSDAANLGNDADGTAVFTENYLSAVDQATDTPTNNFVTWLSDGTIFNIGTDNMVFGEGGTRMLRPAGTGWTTHYANMAASSGKWYFEHESAGANNTMMGAIPVTGTTDNSSGRNNHYLGNVAGHGVGYQFIDRYVYQNGSYALNGGNNANSGNIVQVALDLDNGKIYFGLDNTWITAGTGANPSTGSNGNSLSGWSSEQLWMFAGSTYNPNVQQSTNFGGYTEMSISSAASDENGYGTFEYAPPTGFYALCSKNLAEYG